MIVWGGDRMATSRLNTGGRYNPSTDTWTPTSIGANVPDRRVRTHGGVDRDGDDRLGRLIDGRSHP